MFIDEIEIVAEGGRGGPGKISFFPKRGGPNGGNGGRGGNVYARVNPQMNNLNRYGGRHLFKAESGAPGESNRGDGKHGADRIIDVPPSTTFIDTKTNQKVELNLGDTDLLLAIGGEGGRGNEAFKSPTNRAPRQFEPGQAGETRSLRLILKLIADYGLVGLPNAGKSSLLNALTEAAVKTADYPFTTLEPSLGSLGAKIIADIPGLIEGASGGRGLGVRFLKHIEKVTLILHCISSESTNITRDCEVVTNELRQYSPTLASKDSLLILTKTDLLSPQELKKKLTVLRKMNKKTLAVSILDAKSIAALQKTLTSSIPKLLEQ